MAIPSSITDTDPELTGVPPSPEVIENIKEEVEEINTQQEEPVEDAG